MIYLFLKNGLKYQQRFEHYNCKLIMNHSQFFKEGRWMPSFTLFGNREIVFHHPIQAEGRNSTISSITLNPSYPAQTHLVEKLSQEIYELTTNLSLHPQSAQSLKMSHLRSMMSHVVKASERGTESYHNVLHLEYRFYTWHSNTLPISFQEKQLKR